MPLLLRVDTQLSPLKLQGKKDATNNGEINGKEI